MKLGGTHAPGAPLVPTPMLSDSFMLFGLLLNFRVVLLVPFLRINHCYIIQYIVITSYNVVLYDE